MCCEGQAHIGFEGSSKWHDVNLGEIGCKICRKKIFERQKSWRRRCTRRFGTAFRICNGSIRSEQWLCMHDFAWLYVYDIIWLCIWMTQDLDKVVTFQLCFVCECVSGPVGRHAPDVVVRPFRSIGRIAKTMWSFAWTSGLQSTNLRLLAGWIWRHLNRTNMMNPRGTLFGH